MPRAKKYRSPLKPSNRCAPFKTFKAGTRSEIYAQNLVTFAGDRRHYLGWVFEAKKRFDLSVLNYIVTSTSLSWSKIRDRNVIAASGQAMLTMSVIVSIASLHSNRLGN